MTLQSTQYKNTLSRYLVNNYDPATPITTIVQKAYKALGNPMPTSTLTQDIMSAVTAHTKRVSLESNMSSNTKVVPVKNATKAKGKTKVKIVIPKQQRDANGKFMRKDHPDFVGVDGKTNRARNLEIRNLGQQRDALGAFLKKTDPFFIHPDGMTTMQKQIYPEI